MTPKENKLRKLSDFIGRYKKIGVALSGGVDSSALLAFCAVEKGNVNVTAFSVHTPYIPAREISSSACLCKDLGVELVEVKMDIPKAIEVNPPERCYLCKREIFSNILKSLKLRDCNVLFDGTNADDIYDWRPGMRAISELGIVSPFLECGFSKVDIRTLAHTLSLENADLPADACLLTRIAHGVELNVDMLHKIDIAEDFIRSMGISLVRVRIDETGLATVETDIGGMEILSRSNVYAKAVAEISRLGFVAAVQPRIYKTGAMNKIQHQ